MLTAKAARNLLKDVQFPDDDDHTYLIAVSRKKRKEVLSTGSEEARIAAAVEVQRTWRGYTTRRKLQTILSALSKSASSDEIKSSRFPNVMARYEVYLQWCRRQGMEVDTSSAVLSIEDYCARIIQSWWRRVVLHCNSPEVMQNSDIVVAQKSSRVLDEQSAAAIIQEAWRSYNDKKVYRFYRDLISFQRKGNPALMLRSINPKEAQLLDKAAGAHIRFRLGGERFPPNIYYKVFTSRPVVDLCASSPRDYTTMAYRHKLAKDTHNKEPRTISDDRESWYKRHENNGWRLVADRIFLSPLQDPVTIDTAARKQEFHHSKLQRREDVERRRKEKKIQWLKKMYHQGSLQARQDLSEATTSAVNIAAEQLMELTDHHGAEGVDETDVDELLTWTNGLNYDQYITDWYISASSDSSDPNFQVIPSHEDSHELYIHQNK